MAKDRRTRQSAVSLRSKPRQRPGPDRSGNRSSGLRPSTDPSTTGTTLNTNPLRGFGGAAATPMRGPQINSFRGGGAAPATPMRGPSRPSPIRTPTASTRFSLLAGRMRPPIRGSSVRAASRERCACARRRGTHGSAVTAVELNLVVRGKLVLGDRRAAGRGRTAAALAQMLTSQWRTTVPPMRAARQPARLFRTRVTALASGTESET